MLAGAKTISPGRSDTSLPLLALLWFATLNGAITQRQLIKGLLLSGCLFVVYGESNSGKTFWVLDLALNVAAGLAWRGRKIERGLVLYVAGEGSASVRNRVEAIRRERTDICAEIPFAIVPQAINFLDAGAIDSLILTIRAAETESGERIALVIIDTLNRAMGGGDENSAKDMGAVVAAADRIRSETGAAVGFVHHTGKDVAKGARGHSSLRAAVDTEILIEGQSGTRTASVTKQRDLPSGESFGFELKAVVIGEDDGERITSCVIKHVDTALSPAARGPRGQRQRDILRMLEAEHRAGHPVLPSGEIVRLARARLGIAKQSAHDAVTALATAGFLKMTVGGLALAEAPRP
jgi:hypothetical protein